MIEIQSNSLEELSDFSNRIRDGVLTEKTAASTLFDPALPVHVARAPGRLDIMGGIADYSGSMVLEWPLREATLAAAQSRPDLDSLQLLTRDPQGQERRCTLPLSVLQPGGKPLEYDAARDYFAGNESDYWASYVAGPLLALLHQKGITLSQGMSVYLESSVPEGLGVSSSAAVEVASLKAVTSALGIQLSGGDSARIAQLGENRVAGAACGIMDQMTSSLGEEGRILVLRCQPAKVEGTLQLPEGIAFWGIDSGERHAVSGIRYAIVRAAAFMGYRILTELSELNWKFAPGERYIFIDDVRWGGYLSNVTPLAYEAEFRRSLPENMDGGAFLNRYRGISDPLTRVEPDQSYPVRAAAEHPIYENARVKRFRSLLANCATAEDRAKLGSLMYASHDSYKRCGLDSPGTDRLVELVRAAGAGSGLFGARITGGGGGGTVAVVGEKSQRAQDAMVEIARTYGSETGRMPHVFSGSSPGAEATGVRIIER